MINIWQKLYRIRALKPNRLREINAGDLGGYVESERNLSQDGDCWIGLRGKAYHNGIVTDNAFLVNGEISQNAIIGGTTKVAGGAIIKGNTIIIGESYIAHKPVICGDITLDTIFIGWDGTISSNFDSVKNNIWYKLNEKSYIQFDGDGGGYTILYNGDVICNNTTIRKTKRLLNDYILSINGRYNDVKREYDIITDLGKISANLP